MHTPAVPDASTQTLSPPELESRLVTTVALTVAGLMLLGCGLVVTASILGWLKVPMGNAQAAYALAPDLGVVFASQGDKQTPPLDSAGI